MTAHTANTFLSLDMKARSIHAGKACTEGEGQSGSGQTDESPESIIINCIPVSDEKEVMISQIVDMSLPDNKDDKLEDSVPSSIYGEKSPKEKWLIIPAAEPKHLRKSDMGIPPIIADRSEVVEQQQGRETLYHKPLQLTPERG